MGLKSKLEQARRRAEREGRLEDAVYLEGLINDLVKARGDAAYARAQNTRTYDVKPGDTFFSVAEEELGSVDWAPELVAANEGIYQLHPGIVLHLPEVGEESGLEAFETLEEAEAKAAYAGQGRAGELREMEEARRAANAADAEQARDGVDRDAALEQKADILGLTQEQEEALLQTLEQELPKWLEEWGFGGFGAAAAESTAGTKVDERPAQQGETPEPQGKGGDLAYLERWHEYTLEQLQNSEPTSSAEIIEQMNRYYRLRSKVEAGEITRQDLEGWGYLPGPEIEQSTQSGSLTDEALTELSNISTAGTNLIDENRRPSYKELLENLNLIIGEAAKFDLDTNQLAYLLATAHWESGLGGDMTERWEGNDQQAYFTSLYWDDSEKARELGNLYESDSYVYFGRGFVQLTGRANYTYFGEELGVDLLGDPNLMYRDRELAAEILVYGMVNGTYTGMLAQPDEEGGLNVTLIPEEDRQTLFSYNFPQEFVEARAIIGSQAAEEVATLAIEYACLLQQLCQQEQLPGAIICADAGC